MTELLRAVSLQTAHSPQPGLRVSCVWSARAFGKGVPQVTQGSGKRLRGAVQTPTPPPTPSLTPTLLSQAMRSAEGAQQHRRGSQAHFPQKPVVVVWNTFVGDLLCPCHSGGVAMLCPSGHRVNSDFGEARCGARMDSV